jgi:RNA polymerase sigma-70 factor (ECF subfamily)
MQKVAVEIKPKDEQLMISIHGGDTSAFNELYERYNRRLLYYFYRMLGNSTEKAQDFLQDIFIKIIERPELFDPSRKFSTWIFSVAHNMCKNEYRRMSIRSNTIREDLSTHFHEISEPEFKDDSITAEQIFNALDGFGEIEKTAFLLYYREDFSVQEISKVLSIPDGTVKSKLFYTRKKLLKTLNIEEN